MNVQRFILGSVAVFVFVAAYEWVLHGVVLHDTYVKTASLWRSESDMQNNFHWLMIGQLFLAVMFCFIFTKGYEDKGLAEGLRYGVFIGLLVFVGRNLIVYAVQPVPAKLVITWTVAAS
jgi:drug/metabolite transporter (DMT)-like permease